MEAAAAAAIFTDSTASFAGSYTEPALQQRSPDRRPLNIAPKPPGGSGIQIVGRPESLADSQSVSIAIAVTPKQKTLGGSAFHQPRTFGSGSKRTKRRRRAKYDDDEDEGIIKAGDAISDESDDFTPTATQTKSGRQVQRPSLYVPPVTPPSSKKPRNVTTVGTADEGQAQGARKRKRFYRKGNEINTNCIHCQRGYSPSANVIVFCDACNHAWHQLCHDPPIGNEIVAVRESQWFCRECKPPPSTFNGPILVASLPAKQNDLAFVQNIKAQPFIPRMELGAENFSLEERRGYLSSLSQSTLVELLGSLSSNNPTIPVFPSNLRDLQLSKFAFQPGIVAPTNDAMQTPIATATTSNSPAQPTKPDSPANANAERGALPEEVLPGFPNSKKQHQSDEDSENEQFEDHRIYPRVGNGFRLSIKAEDINILAEDPACPTFSSCLHGPAKVRAEAKQATPVWIPG